MARNRVNIVSCQNTYSLILMINFIFFIQQGVSLTSFAFMYEGDVFNELLIEKLNIKSFETFLNSDDSRRYMAFVLKKRRRAADLENKIRVYNERICSSDDMRIFLKKDSSKDDFLIPVYLNNRNPFHKNAIFEAIQSAKDRRDPTYVFKFFHDEDDSMDSPVVSPSTADEPLNFSEEPESVSLDPPVGPAQPSSVVAAPSHVDNVVDYARLQALEQKLADLEETNRVLVSKESVYQIAFSSIEARLKAKDDTHAELMKIQEEKYLSIIKEKDETYLAIIKEKDETRLAIIKEKDETHLAIIKDKDSNHAEAMKAQVEISRLKEEKYLETIRVNADSYFQVVFEKDKNYNEMVDEKNRSFNEMLKVNYYSTRRQDEMIEYLKNVHKRPRPSS